MTPEALILFYEPNHIYKNRKYLLSLGNNFVGSNPESQIYIDDKNLPQQAAAIRLRNDILTLVRLDDMANVMVESNLIPKKKICLQKNVEYILIPDKEFQIGRWRGLFKIITEEEARMLNGVVNRHMFNWDAETKKEELDNSDVGNSLIDQIPSLVSNNKVGEVEEKRMEIEIQQSATLVLSDSNMGPTLILPEDEGDDQTEKLDQSDGEGQMPQTLVEKTQMSPNQKSQSPSSKVNKGKVSKLESSIKMTKTLMEQEDGMPATLEDAADEKQEETREIKPRNVTSAYQSGQSAPVVNSGPSLNNTARYLESERCKTGMNTCPEYMRKSDSSNIRKTESLEDLFGLAPIKNSFQEQSNQPTREQEKNSLVRSGKPSQVALKISQEQSEEKLQRIQIKRPENNTDKQQKRIAITGFKLNDMQKHFMSKRNMRIIESPDEEYDLLIIAKQPKITRRLLEAIVKGIEVQTEAYLTGNNGEISHQFMGIPWKQISTKQNRSKLYKDKRVFLSESLHTYKQIIQLCGGTVVEALTKTKGYIMLFVVPEDVELYKQYQTHKTKGFYNQTMLQRSILTNTLPEAQVENSFFK